MKAIKKTLAVASLALLGVSPSYSQVPDLSALTSLGGGLGGISAPSFGSLPLLGDLGGLLGGLGGGLGGLGGLASLGGGAGGLDGIPVLGSGLVFIVDGDFLPRLLPDPVELMQLTNGSAVVTNIVVGAIGEPQAVFSTVNELGINAGVAAVPVFGVLLENPAGLLDFFMGGGTILTQALNGTDGNSIVPGIPILTQPLGL